MSDESKKPSLPPGDRRGALARKLTGGQRIPPPSSAPPSPSMRAPAAPGPSIPPAAVPSSAPVSSKPSIPATSLPSTPSVVPSSGREAVLASRRNAVTDARTPGAPRPPPPEDDDAAEEAPAKEPPVKTRPGILALGALLAVVALAFAGSWAREAFRASTPEGRVRDTFVTWEFSPVSAREGVFVQLDQLGPTALPAVIQSLGDTSVAERDDSHSTRSIREVAHLYLIRLATNLKVAPPKPSEEVAKAIFLGTAPSEAQWKASQDAWRAWLEAQQAKGTIAKP
jgi:hypothetical protein